MARKYFQILLMQFMALALLACHGGLEEGPLPAPPPAEDEHPIDEYSLGEEGYFLDEDGYPIEEEYSESYEIRDEPLVRGPDNRIYLEERDQIALTPPAPGPTIYGEEVNFDKRKLRFASWNVHVLTPKTATDDKHKVKLKPMGATAERTVTKKEAIFKTLQANGVHIAVLQEVYGPVIGAAALTDGAVEHGYKIVLGEYIKTKYDDPEDVEEDDAVNDGLQYCPIVALPEFECKHHRTDQDSRTNWAKCKVSNATGTKYTLYAGCSHFDTGAGELASNIQVFLEQLNSKNPANNKYYHPRIPTMGEGDNLIFGVDANSSPFAPTGNPWTAHNAKWCCRPPTVKPALSQLHLPKLKDYDTTSTKFNKEGQRPNQKPYMSNDPQQRNIDFIGQRLKPPEIEYINGSMAALDVELMHMGLVGKQFWLNWYNAGDHIPVKSDYEIK